MTSWFQDFNKNLYIDHTDVAAIAVRYKRITRQLNRSFWDSESELAHSLYVGSYGRDTDIHISDIDMIFQLPWEKYGQYNNYFGNGQSALLQQVKNSLIQTYPRTSMRADGQVVVVNFYDGICFEIVPVFKYSDGSYLYPDTNNGGTWKEMNPKPEIDEVYAANKRWNKNYKRLCRMARAWRDQCEVNVKGILVDTMAYHFMKDWPYRDRSYLYYDWMVRDFFEYMYDARSNNLGWEIPGSRETIYKSGIFTSKAKHAYDKTLDAINKYSNDMPFTANKLWREIFGSNFPSKS